MAGISRRRWLERSLVGGAAALGLPLVGKASSGEPQAAKVMLKIIVAGGHPDDPESGCGGTMALYADAGHEVVSLYLTRGEAGIPGKSHAEAAAIRTAECERACQILHARPVFAGQIDGATEVTPARYDEFRKILESEKPDIVFTHFPVDTHRDHRAVSLLVYDAWLQTKSFELFYFEVLTGHQTQDFHPVRFVDITSTEARKRAACFAHASQNPAEFYALHDEMNRFRGLECGCRYAEGFALHAQNPARLPG